MKQLTAPKKAAKKAPAKHAAKHAAKQADPKRPGKDTRRAYEHLGRIQSLSASVADGAEAAKSLAAHAEKALRADQPKDAADLLRAAEHNLFGLLATRHPADKGLSPVLTEAIQDELQKLQQRAEEHGGCANAPASIRTLYRAMQREANTAVTDGRFRAALEYARGAEALTHVTFSHTLPAPVERRKLK